MKNLELRIILTSLVTIMMLSFGSAQNYCEKWLTPELESIEALIEELKITSAGEDFDTKMEKVNKDIMNTESKIKSCAMRSHVSVDVLKERLKKSKNDLLLLNGEKPVVEQNQDIDFADKNRFIYKMQQCVDRYGLRNLKEEDKIFTRSEIEVLENYKDDGSQYYKTNIIIGQNYLDNLKSNVNKDSWVKNAKTTIDNKAKSINVDLTKKYMNGFYNDLIYIKEVAMPNNINLKTIINYLKNHL